MGYLLKVSCATPVLGSACGALSVGFASALAGQASRTTSRIFISGKLEMPDLREFKWSNVDVEEVLLDAVLGMCFYRVSCSPANLPDSYVHDELMTWCLHPSEGGPSDRGMRWMLTGGPTTSHTMSDCSGQHQHPTDHLARHDAIITGITAGCSTVSGWLPARQHERSTDRCCHKIILCDSAAQTVDVSLLYHLLIISSTY